jgi:hypothetical protein
MNIQRSLHKLSSFLFVFLTCTYFSLPASSEQQTYNGGTSSLQCISFGQGQAFWALQSNFDVLFAVQLSFVFSSGVVKEKISTYIPAPVLQDVENSTTGGREDSVIMSGSALGLIGAYEIPPLVAKCVGNN